MIDDFVTNHTDSEVAVITYQISGAQVVPQGSNRYYLYDPLGTPTVAGDGMVDIWPCLYSDMESHFNSRTNVASPLTISITEDSEGEFTAHITAESAVSGTFMMVAFEEISHGGRDYPRWARTFVTPYTGEAFSIGAGETQHLTRSFTVDPSWVYDNMGVVAWVYSRSNAKWEQFPAVQAATGYANSGEPTPVPTVTPTVTPTSTECINNGDVNLSGDITSGDAQDCFLIALGTITPTYEQECAADCNGDAGVTAGDAQTIFLTVLGSGSCIDPV